MRHSAFYRPYLPLIRWPERLWKSVAWLVIACFSINCLNPGIVAAKTVIREKALSAPPVKTEFDLAEESLVALEETLDRMDRRLNGKFEFAWQEILAQKSHATPPAAAARADLAAREADIRSGATQLDAQQTAIQSFFTQTQSDLKTRGVPAAVQSRATTQGTQYAQLYAQLKTLLAAIPAAKTDADYRTAVAAAASFLRTHSSKPKRAKFDPSHLAFGTPKERPRQPITDANGLKAALNATDKSLPQRTPKSAKGSNATEHAKDLPANLAPTEDVQITPAIQAKAAALNNNPLAIYQFVRNNVEYMPTYGSIEGSDYTLQTLRGNDMDQASLLIALLRAAGIPSHYVYGTIQVPIAQVENWVGGVTDPNAALDLMGQGGIPALGLAEGGVIKYAQLEHVWVEALIGMAPSRGAVTTVGTTWIQIDPSFKQYAYSQGMGLAAGIPFDSATFASVITSTSATSTSEGWVQNIDGSYVGSQFAGYETAVRNYIQQQNADASIGDVLGKKVIVRDELPYLAGALPYKALNASTMDALPSSVRWAFHALVDGAELLNVGLPNVAGRAVALSFRPSTEQDETALESYLPRGLQSLADLPSALPAGLANLTIEVDLDGQAVTTKDGYRLGDPVTITKGLYRPLRGWQDGDKVLTCGDYQVLGIVGQSISKAEVASRQTDAQNTLNKFQNQQYASLDRENVTGALLRSTLLNYFSQVIAFRHNSMRASSLIEYPLPSYGSVSTGSDVASLFGVPAKVSPKGVVVDMDHVASINVHGQANAAQRLYANRIVGSIVSHAESGLLEQQFGPSGQANAAVSAVKLLTVANSQGQRIYTINSANAPAVLPILELPSVVLQDVAGSVNAGLEVTVSAGLVNYGGQNTAGYIVLDPVTGSASYKIASGEDGGKILLFAGLIFLLLLSACLFPAIGVILFELLVAQSFVGELALALTEVFETLLVCLKAVDLGKDAAKILDSCDTVDGICVVLAILMLAGVEIALGPAPLTLDYLLFGVVDVGMDAADAVIESTCEH